MFFDGFTLERVGGLRVRHGGAGPAVLLLHGHPRTHTTWWRVAPLLVSAGFTVVCPDLHFIDVVAVLVSGVAEGDRLREVEGVRTAEAVGELHGGRCEPRKRRRSLRSFGSFGLVAEEVPGTVDADAARRRGDGRASARHQRHQQRECQGACGSRGDDTRAGWASPSRVQGVAHDHEMLQVVVVGSRDGGTSDAAPYREPFATINKNRERERRDRRASPHASLRTARDARGSVEHISIASDHAADLPTSRLSIPAFSA